MVEFHRAVVGGDLQRVKELVEKGADVNARDEDGFTPLHWAAALGTREVVGFLIDRGADVNARDGHGRTPLHNAALFGRLEAARLLVEKGADVNARDNADRTPLHYAAFNGQLEVARFLLESGANPIVRSSSGKTPSDLARREGYGELAELIEDWSRKSQELEAPPAELIASIEVGGLVEGEWGTLRVKLNARSTLTVEGDVEWTGSGEGEDMVELRVKPRKPGELPLTIVAKSDDREERKTILVEVLRKSEVEELIHRLEVIEKEVRKYQSYIEKLEQIREKMKISDNVYQALKDNYTIELLKHQIELEELKKKLEELKIKREMIMK